MNTRLLWHQFRKETREHLWFTIGYGIIVAIYTYMGACGLFETVTDKWDRPIILDNEMFMLFISLVPAIFYAPFIAFADPTDSPDAFWLTKPPRAAIVVGGKLLWITVWLIGMPLIGECIMVVALGGGMKVFYVAIDYVHLHAAFAFGAFALGTVATNPIRLILGALAIPVMMEFLGALARTILGDELSDEIPYTASVALSWLWIGIVSAGAIAIACAQYRWRRPLQVGLPAGVLLLSAALLAERLKVDLTNRPVVGADHPFAASTARLATIRIAPGELTGGGIGRSHLTAHATFEKLPHGCALGIVELDLTFSVNGRKRRVRHLSKDWGGFDDEHQDRPRVYRDLVERIGDASSSATATLRCRIRVPLPRDLEEDLANAPTIKVSGRVRADCFGYEEFGRIQPPPYDGPTFPPTNRRDPATFRKNDVLLTLFWPVAPGNVRQVAVQYRQISATLAPDNAELWTRAHQHVAPWYYVPRNTRSGTAWKDYAGQTIESNFTSPRTALHLNRGWFSIPSSFPADEIVVFRARHLGQRTIELSTQPAAAR